MKEKFNRLFEVPFYIRQKFGDKHPVFISYTPSGLIEIDCGQYIAKSESFCQYMVSSGLQKGDCVVSLLNNSAECSWTEMGTLSAGGVFAPLSALLSDERIKQILRMLKPRFIITAGSNIFNRLQSFGHELPVLSTVINISTEPVFEYPVLKDLVESRKSNVSPDDRAVILFTSGSTGSPKGVVLSHRNVLAGVKEFSAADVFSGCRRSLSLLPLSQSAERKMSLSCQVNGISICYPRASKDMLYNIRLFKPDITALVPYLLNELYGQVKEEDNKHNIKIFCGGAAVPSELSRSMMESGISVYEVYGLTETASLLSFNTKKNNKPGTVGKVPGSVKVSLSDEGEILVMGDNIMEGYLLENKQTDLARDGNGWFHTGDLGTLDEEGYLKINGRIKTAFKNSRGIYIYPEEIERELMKGSLFGHVTVYGENADTLTAVIIPQAGFSDREFLIAGIKSSIERWNVGKSEYMKIGRYVLLDKLSQDNVNLVSLKMDRHRIAEKVKEELVNFILV